MPRTIDLLSTIDHSPFRSFLPGGWDLARIRACTRTPKAKALQRHAFWNKAFKPQAVADVATMDRAMGLEIARVIREAHHAGTPLAMILPVGPMGMYRHAVAELKRTRTPCTHVHTFNMDEWSDHLGRTMPAHSPSSFEYAMNQAFFAPLGIFTVPKAQRNFATKVNLPTYAPKIAALRSQGAKLVTVYGIGRVCHIAFWEPHLADGLTESTWRRETHRVAVALHPLTIEQNAITSFNSNVTSVPAFANTVGPGLFLTSDWCIGGCDGAYPERGAQWQGQSVAITLHHGPSPWLTSTYMPTLPGKLFILKPLLTPLGADLH
jgi:glucosamine-6-phosphate deaminase